MSTLAIPPMRVRLYRVLWDRWIIVLRILFDLGAGSHPVKWRAVADTLLVDKKTCQKYIAGLVRDGHITPAGDGYMLTQAGMDTLLENEQGGEILPSSGEKIPGRNSQLLESVVVVDSELNLTSTPTTPESGKNPGEKISPADNRVGRYFSADVQAALDHADLLFDGAQVAQQGLDYYLHLEKVLGWLAYAYDKRSALYGPAGLVRNKLKDPASPSPSMKYMKDPLAFFPDEYLDAIGFAPRAVEPGAVEIDTYVETRPSRDATITDAIQQRFDQAMTTWEAQIGKARNEEAGLFTSFVKGCWPVAFDGRTLTIGVHNDVVCGILERKATGKMTELLGWPVVFVVAVETEE